MGMVRAWLTFLYVLHCKGVPIDNISNSEYTRQAVHVAVRVAVRVAVETFQIFEWSSF